MTTTALPQPDGLIFDIDDTLVDTTPSYKGAIVATCAHFGVTCTLEDITAIKARGNANNDWKVTWQLLTENGIAISLDAVTAEFERRYQGTTVCPGLKEQETLLLPGSELRRLAHIFTLGIVTGRPKKDALYFLNKHQFADLFAAVVTMDDGPLKPDPFPIRRAWNQMGVKTVWMIGDTPDDIFAAKSAGATAIGVIAPGDEAEAGRTALMGAGADHVLNHITQLMKLISP